MTELSSLVAPRVSVFQGAERVPITDVLEIILDTSQRQVVLLTGVDCEYAQIYLRNFYRNDSRISVAEVAVWSDVDETCRVLICSESRTVLSYTLSVAPWDRDDVIQYMLGSNPAECGSILKRISPECFAMIRGGFNFWKHLVETMLEFPRETDLGVAQQ